MGVFGLPILLTVILGIGETPCLGQSGPNSTPTPHGLGSGNKVWGNPLLSHGGPVVTVKVGPGGHRIVSIGEPTDGRVRSAVVWVLETTWKRKEIPGPHRLEAFSISMDGRRRATSLLSTEVPDNSQEAMHQAGVVLGPLRTPFTQKLQDPHSFAGISCPGPLSGNDPDQKALSDLPALHFEGRLALYDDLRHRAHLDPAYPTMSVALSSDGRLVASSHLTPGIGTLRVATADGQTLWTVAVGNCRRLRFSPDSRRLLATGFGKSGPRHGYILFDAQTGDVQHKTNQAFKLGFARDGSFSPDGRTVGIVGGSSKEDPIGLFDAGSGDLIKRIPCYRQGNLTTLDYFPKGDRIVVSGDNGMLQIIPIEDNKEAPPAHRAPVNSIALLEGDHPRLASVDASGRLLVRHPSQESTREHFFGTHDPAPLLFPWNLSTASLSVVVSGFAPGERSEAILLAPWGSGSVHIMSPLGTGNALAILRRRISPPLTPTVMDADPRHIVIGNQDGRVTLFPVHGGSEQHLSMFAEPVLAVALVGGENGLVSASVEGFATYRLSSSPPYARLHRYRDLPSNTRGPITLGASGTHLVVTTRESTPVPSGPYFLESRDVATGRILARSRGLDSEPLALAISSDGKYLAAALINRKVALYSITDLVSLGRFSSPAVPLCLVFDLNHKALLVGHDDGTIRSFPLP